MTDKKHNAQFEQEEQNEQDELRDLSVPDQDAEGVKGGIFAGHYRDGKFAA